VITFALSLIGIVLLFQRNRAPQRKEESSKTDEPPRP
jgi:hypothetical protein